MSNFLKHPAYTVYIGVFIKICLIICISHCAHKIRTNLFLAMNVNIQESNDNASEAFQAHFLSNQIQG